MKVALAADFHLDSRQFNRQQRWRDFIDTFDRVTRTIAAQRVDAYVIAGDLFERYKPHPGVVRHFLREVSQLDCPVILIRGNHDSPRIFYEKFGGDTLHLLEDISEIVYLNQATPCYELGDACFIGLGYVGVNAARAIAAHVQAVPTSASTRLGIFHQLLDYPGVPEYLAEVSINFLQGLTLDYLLLGHWHNRYTQGTLYNPGSPEYWSFDQGERIRVNLDTGEVRTTPAKAKGFYLIDTTAGHGAFVDVEPARPMFDITYQTDGFEAAVHVPRIKEHLARYDRDGVMVKTTVQGVSRYGKVNLGKQLALDRPLLHHVATNLKPTAPSIAAVDSRRAQMEYLQGRGIDRDASHRLAEWLETNKDALATMSSQELLTALRAALQVEPDT